MLYRVKNFGNELVFLSLILPLVLVESLGHAGDILTTWYALTYCGAHEANPLLAPLLNSRWKLRWIAGAAIKGSFVSHNVRYYLKSKDSKWARYYNIRGAIFGAILVWVVVAWNFSVILRRKRANTST